MVDEESWSGLPGRSIEANWGESSEEEEEEEAVEAVEEAECVRRWCTAEVDVVVVGEWGCVVLVGSGARPAGGGWLGVEEDEEVEVGAVVVEEDNDGRVVVVVEVEDDDGFVVVTVVVVLDLVFCVDVQVLVVRELLGGCVGMR